MWGQDFGDHGTALRPACELAAGRRLGRRKTGLLPVRPACESWPTGGGGAQVGADEARGTAGAGSDQFADLVRRVGAG